MKKKYLRPEAATIRLQAESSMLTASPIGGHDEYSSSGQLSGGREEGGWNSSAWSGMDDDNADR